MCEEQRGQVLQAERAACHDARVAHAQFMTLRVLEPAAPVTARQQRSFICFCNWTKNYPHGRYPESSLSCYPYGLKKWKIDVGTHFLERYFNGLIFKMYSLFM